MTTARDASEQPAGGAHTRLEGDCFVTHLRAGKPILQGTLSCWPLVGRCTGAVHISLRTYAFAPGDGPALGVHDWDEVWYVLQGRGEIDLHGEKYSVRDGTGIHLQPGSRVRVRNPGPDDLVVVASRCPDPETDLDLDDGEAPSTGTMGQNSQRASGRAKECRGAGPLQPLVHLSECEPETTGERAFRVLVDARLGCEPVTQFVGTIPPGRAPDHAHDYEEVLCVLDGTGEMWAGSQSAPIAPGSCVYLPRGQMHCVENRGSGALQLLGVFYPAGSPAARMDMQSAPAKRSLAQHSASEEEE